MLSHADLGTVNHVVLSFPGPTIPFAGFDQLRDLEVDDRINIVDIEFLAKAPDGTVSWRSAEDVGLASFAASATHLIDEDDRASAGAAMAPGSVAAIVVWEDLTLQNVVRTWHAGGATVLSDGAVADSKLVSLKKPTAR